MELLVQRGPSSSLSCLGDLSIDSKPFCVTLEDPVRPKKIYGITAISAGRYRVIISLSKRFGRKMPEILSVPNFEGVRIHPLNFPNETDGCLGVGARKGTDRIFDSQKTYDALFARMTQADAAGEEIWITYVDFAS